MFAGLTQTPFTPSEAVSFRPTSEPSKYKDQLTPSGLRVIKSSSVPETAGTLYDPVVLISRLPSGAKSTESISSALEVRPAMEPVRNAENSPVVLSPNEVGMNLKISESSTEPIVGRLAGASRLISRLPSGIKAKALISPLMPTSEPSKKSDHAPVAGSKARISSSLKARPAIVPLLEELR